MEALTRLVSESLARHGFDRPLDFRRLKWSSWFRCESHHSLLFVPSKAGVFALAEEVGSGPVERSTAGSTTSRPAASVRDFYPDTPRAVPLGAANRAGAFAAELHRTLAVTQFFEADDMAFVLDRMLSRYNPMRARLESGRYFIRFVIIEDESQRHSMFSALNQWIHSSAEKNAGTGGPFATSVELTPATESVRTQPENPQADLFSSAEMGRVIFSAHVATSTSAAPRTLSEVSESGPVTAADSRLQAPDSKSSAPPVPRPSGADIKIQSPPAFPSGF